MSLLTICQNSVDALGFGGRPASIIGNSDALARQMLAILNSQVIKYLLRKHTWQALTNLHTITTVASDDNYALPSDWDRYISDTFWDTTNYRTMGGSVTPQEWRYLKHSIVASSSFHRRIRVYRDQVYIYPTPTANNDSLVAEYVSNKPVLNFEGDTYRTQFSADTDTLEIDEQLAELQLQWRLLKAKGLDYAEALNGAERALEVAIAHDTPALAVNLGAPVETHVINIPPEIT